MKTVLVIVGVVGLGIAIVVEGISEAFGRVLCRGQVMSPEQICTTVEKHRQVVRDFAAQEARQHFEGFVEIGMGVAVLLVVALVLVGRLHLRRRAAHRPAGERAERPPSFGR